MKLAKTKKPRMESVRARLLEFKVASHNKFSLLNEQEEEVSVDRRNDNLSSALRKSAAAVGEAASGEQAGKLPRRRK